MEQINNVAVIGMGPSGIAASIYLARSNMHPVCFEEKEIGGKLNLMKEIENYPGYIGSGKGLAEDFRKQVEHFQIEVRKESVRSITRNEDGTFLIKTDKDQYLFKAVIIATGIREKPFAVPGSDAYFGNGLSRCAECDAPFHKNKPVAVVGNSEEAVKDTIYLASICSPVYLINEEEGYKADEKDVKELASLGNVIVKEGYKIVDSQGRMRLQGITIENKEGKKENLEVEGLFIFTGATPMADFLGYMDILDEKGNIKVNEHMQTSVPGLFSCGDVRNSVMRQVVTAVNDGGIAAVSARNYLHSLSK